MKHRSRLNINKTFLCTKIPLPEGFSFWFDLTLNLFWNICLLLWFNIFWSACTNFAEQRCHCAGHYCYRDSSYADVLLSVSLLRSCLSLSLSKFHSSSLLSSLLAPFIHLLVIYFCYVWRNSTHFQKYQFLKIFIHDKSFVAIIFQIQISF